MQEKSRLYSFLFVGRGIKKDCVEQVSVFPIKFGSIGAFARPALSCLFAVYLSLSFPSSFPSSLSQNYLVHSMLPPALTAHRIMLASSFPNAHSQLPHSQFESIYSFENMQPLPISILILGNLVIIDFSKRQYYPRSLSLDHRYFTQLSQHQL